MGEYVFMEAVDCQCVGGERKMSKRLIISKEHPFDSIGQMEVGTEGQATYNVARTFLSYLTTLAEKEKKRVMEQVVEQQLEKRLMQVSSDHPFHGDEEGFEKYCRVKYKLLYDHIIQMIEGLQ